jgi:hypothetical protein
MRPNRIRIVNRLFRANETAPIDLFFKHPPVVAWPQVAFTLYDLGPFSLSCPKRLVYPIYPMRLNHSVFTRVFYRLMGRDPVAEYYKWLSQFGRVADGHILDFQQDESGLIIFYRYKVANVDYETSQRLSGEQLARKDAYGPGARVLVRFDPKQPGLSIVP